MQHSRIEYHTEYDDWHKWFLKFLEHDYDDNVWLFIADYLKKDPYLNAHMLFGEDYECGDIYLWSWAYEAHGNSNNYPRTIANLKDLIKECVKEQPEDLMVLHQYLKECIWIVEGALVVTAPEKEIEVTR